jgi:hypothetical protein
MCSLPHMLSDARLPRLMLSQLIRPEPRLAATAVLYVWLLQQLAVPWHSPRARIMARSPATLPPLTNMPSSSRHPGGLHRVTGTVVAGQAGDGAVQSGCQPESQ